MVCKIKHTFFLIFISQLYYGQYFNPSTYALNNIAFEDKKLAHGYSTAFKNNFDDNSLLEFTTVFNKAVSDSISMNDKICGYLVKSVYSISIRKYKNALEHAIFASRLSTPINKVINHELSLLLQAQVYYLLSSSKNISALIKDRFTNKDIEFQTYYLCASSHLQSNNPYSCNTICETLLNDAQVKTYDHIQVLKLYSASLEQDANYKKALEVAYGMDTIINPDIKYPIGKIKHSNTIYNTDTKRLLSFSEIKNKNFFYNSVSEENYAQKMELENVILKNNIGFLLLKSKQLKDAEATFYEALKLAKKNKSPHLQQQLEKNIGLTYTLLKSYSKAEEHYLLSEKISAAQDNSTQLAEILCIRGKNQYLMNNLPMARELCEKSIKIATETKNFNQLSQSYSVLAEINAHAGDIQKAVFYSKQAQENADLAKNVFGIAELENEANEIKEEAAYDVFANEKADLERIQLKLEASKRQQEIELIKKESQIREAGLLAEKLQNEKAQQALVILEHEFLAVNQQKEFERIRKDRTINILQNKNSQTRIKLLNKQKKLDDEMKAQKEKDFQYSKERERSLRTLLFASLAIIGLIVFLLYRNIKNARLISATNIKLEETTINLQSTNAVLENSLQEINKQTAIIESKNNQITESITYAQRIQYASLPKIDELEAVSKDCFVLYKPKDIISGDFYMSSRHIGLNENMCDVLIVADCTGHGVPGAMLSLLCSNIVRQALKQTEVYTPSEILNNVNNQLKNFFRSKEEDAFKDGMDIACCMLDKQNGKLHFASAGRPLIIIRKDEAIELKGEKHHIGFSNVGVSFQDQIVDIHAGDSLYLFTDGYTDQFNGETRKRFMTKNFKNLLLSLQDKPMKKQGEVLDLEFEKWRGSYMQMDDVCLLGIKI